MHNAVVDAVGATLDRLPYGDPSDESHLMGPLISERQRVRVEGLVAVARSEGAAVLRGGRRPEHLPGGYFYEPTVLVGVGEDDAIAQQEVFGQVLSVIAHDSDDSEAVRIANSSKFGLSGAVASADGERAQAVGVNGGVYHGPGAPFGGYKQPGTGRGTGVAGFEEFWEIKTLADPRHEDMTVLLAVAGAGLGAVVAGLPGLLAGGAIGCLLGQQLDPRKRSLDSCSPTPRPCSLRAPGTSPHC